MMTMTVTKIMMTKRIDVASVVALENFLHTQLSEWRMAADNYIMLGNIRTRNISLGDFEIKVVNIPSRIVSGTAKVDKESILKRKCFLCGENRPVSQSAACFPACPDFDILVNPMPVFNPHFVISSISHIPQATPPGEMIDFARQFPSFVFFFNGAASGASAPDHLHFQAVRTAEVPLTEFVEKNFTDDGIFWTGDAGFDLPFNFWVMNGLDSVKRSFKYPYPDKMNLFIWRGSDDIIRSVLVPRSAHRPKCYYETGENRILFSPGALDMGGAVILPLADDFDKITPEILFKAYSETGYASRDKKLLPFIYE